MKIQELLDIISHLFNVYESQFTTERKQIKCVIETSNNKYVYDGDTFLIKCAPEKPKMQDD